MGDEVIGDVSAFMYSAALDTPRNRAFVTKYRSCCPRRPMRDQLQTTGPGAKPESG
jgi:hypothetical protein